MDFVDYMILIKLLEECLKKATIVSLRKLFSILASIVDRIGIASPVNIRFKVALQKNMTAGIKIEHAVYLRIYIEHCINHIGEVL